MKEKLFGLEMADNRLMCMINEMCMTDRISMT